MGVREEEGVREKERYAHVREREEIDNIYRGGG